MGGCPSDLIFGDERAFVVDDGWSLDVFDIPRRVDSTDFRGRMAKAPGDSRSAESCHLNRQVDACRDRQFDQPDSVVSGVLP